jgi:hypothetical protein
LRKGEVLSAHYQYRRRRPGSAQRASSTGAAAGAFTEAVGASFATCPSVGVKNESTDSIATDAPTGFRSRCVSHLLLPNTGQCPRQRQAALRRLTSIPSSRLLPRPSPRRALRRGCWPWRNSPRDMRIRRRDPRSCASEPLLSMASSTPSDLRP